MRALPGRVSLTPFAHARVPVPLHTQLHLASRHGNLECCKLLLKEMTKKRRAAAAASGSGEGADPEQVPAVLVVRNKRKETAYEVAGTVKPSKKELKELESLHKTQRDWESDNPGTAACMCLM